MPRPKLKGIYRAVVEAKSQKNLADALKLKSVQVVQAWVAKGYVPMKHVKRIEELYGIPAEELCNPKYLEDKKK